MRRLSFALSVLSIAMCSVASATTFEAQDFEIYKGGNMSGWMTGSNAFFSDEFDDGISPPSAPNFANGTAASYTVTGSVSETPGCTLYPGGLSCGGLSITPDAGVLATNAVGVSSMVSGIRLNTNIDPTKPTAGLNIGSSFLFTASFGLRNLPTAGYSYGIRLGDAFSDKNDVLDLRVVDSSDGLSLVFSKQDFVSGTVTILDTVLLTPPTDDATSSIDLAFMHAVGGSHEIQALYGYYSDYSGACIGTCYSALDTTATAFNGEDFTRAEVRALQTVSAQAVPEPNELAMVFTGLGLMGFLSWRRTRHG